ncbi:MAG: universal stress protein [Deltaproteobacteria bacterium]
MKRFLEKIQEMRFLPVFVVLSMVIGIAIGKWYGISNFELTPPIDAIKSIFHGTYQFSLANSLALGVVIGLFLMIYPAMTNVKVEDMGKAARSPRQLLIVLFFNYLVAPFFMLLLARVFLAGDHDLYIGLVLYGLAPCIAMVIVFTFLSLGNNALAIILVAINSVCQMLLIPVYAKLLLGEVTFDVLVVGESVLLYLGLPLFAGFLTRRIAVGRLGEEGFKVFKTYLDSLSIIGLLFTLIVMFALKGDLILERPLIILQMAIPMTIFFWVMFAVVYLTSWKMGLNYKDSVAVAFNSTGRDFEIAIAIAITAFSPAVALATVVGPLIEVPVMLALVWAARKSESALFKEIPAAVPVLERAPVFGKILFPTDFSPHATKIMELIPELKRAGLQEAVFLHVINPMKATRWIGVDEKFIERTRAEADRRLKGICEDIASAHGITVKCRVQLGVTHQEIIRVAGEEKASLIIMGSHGHGYFKGALLGSNTQSVMRQAKIPLLIERFRRVASGGEEALAFVSRSLFGKVLYPTDFSPNSQLAMQVIEQLRKDLVQEVVVAHIQDTRVLVPYLQEKLNEFNRIDTERLSAIKDRLFSLGYPVKTILKTGIPFREINAIAEEENVSLIVMGSHGKSNVREAYTGSETEFITLQHVRPVLVIPRNREAERSEAK